MPEPERFPARDRLRADVEQLAVPRHARTNPAELRAAEDHVALELAAAGLRVERQPFASGAGSPGADDNASGVAAMLEVARALGRERLPSTVQFVGFNLEEVQ